jgi:hypothetical protein
MIKNYYEPLSSFAPHEEIDMARDKAQAATAMRVRMCMLRSGPSTATAQQPSTGRRGGRGGGGMGRGGGSKTIRDNKESQETTYKAKLLSLKNQTTTDNKTVVTISNITEQSTETATDMEEEDNGLSGNMKKGIPSSIETFTPNIQWTRDMPKNLPRRRYGLEIKITPETSPSSTDLPPAYHHIRIFKAITTAILTAAPGTMICSKNDEEEGIINVEDIPTTQNSVDHYLDSPMINMKTHSYHA